MNTQYRDMSDEEMLAWGAAESAARKADLAASRTPAGLLAAQENANQRRKLIGATMGQAADMVIRANREARRQGSPA